MKDDNTNKQTNKSFKLPLPLSSVTTLIDNLLVFLWTAILKLKNSNKGGGTLHGVGEDLLLYSSSHDCLRVVVGTPQPYTFYTFKQIGKHMLLSRENLLFVQFPLMS